MPAVIVVVISLAAAVVIAVIGGARNLVNWERLLDGFLHLLYHD